MVQKKEREINLLSEKNDLLSENTFQEEKARYNTTVSMWGIILLCIALGIVMYKLEVPGWDLLPDISLWQLVLGAACVCWFVNSITSWQYMGMTFSVAFLGIIFNHQLHIEKLVPWTLLVVAVIVAIALELIFGKKHKNYYDANRPNPGHNPEMRGETVEGDNIVENVSFTGVTKHIHSDNFKSAIINCSFGSADIFLDRVLLTSFL